ncbi:Assembly chaperone of RPL4 [Candida viswanathii]|uniref:Assembly chaperone of RPL4 n=1 Tax=Candida viswanathii TaxID=5486 RepID=A0A367YDC9_9ASCO|nr:Assembly chaperone of RPL4 [Candida viswanathii]
MQPEQAVELLVSNLDAHKDSVPYLTALGQAYLEINEVQEAYDTFVRACELDPEAREGAEKFLTLGQIIGGRDGLHTIDTGIRLLKNKLESSLAEYPKDLFESEEEYRSDIVKQITLSVSSEIEIWMTDLCMEPEAERMCEELIDYSLNLDNTNPESYAMLASIRISQQRNDDAIEAVQKSWEFYKKKIADLEYKSEHGTAKEIFDVGMEHADLIQPLIALARYAIELEQYDIALEVSDSIQEINDGILDAYYVEILAYTSKARQLLNTPEIQMSELSAHPDEAIRALMQEARYSATQIHKILQTDDAREFDGELVQQLNQLMTEVGGPIMSELMPPKRSKNDDDEDIEWEDLDEVD